MTEGLGIRHLEVHCRLLEQLPVRSHAFEPKDAPTFEEKERQRHQTWRDQNRELIRKRARAYYAKNKKRIRERANANYHAAKS